MSQTTKRSRSPGRARAGGKRAGPRTRTKKPASPLTIWLTKVIQGLSGFIYNSSKWSETLSVSPQAIGYWLRGQGTPNPGNLEAIITVLEAGYPDVAVDVLREFWDLAARPLAETAPGAKHSAPTLDDYLTEASRERFHRALAPLTPKEQRALLQEATIACNHRLLGVRDPAAYPEPVRLPSTENITTPDAVPEDRSSKTIAVVRDVPAVKIDEMVREIIHRHQAEPIARRPESMWSHRGMAA